MSFVAMISAVELGLVYALVVLGLVLSYRVLNIPDLTVDGSFTLGAAVSVMLAAAGHSWLGLLAGAAAGALAGVVTAFLQTKCRVQPILAGIITMTALYSINLMVMDNKANVPITTDQSVFYQLGAVVGKPAQGLVLGGGMALIVSVVLVLFLMTPLGMAVRATGDNEAMVRSSSINADFTKAVGLAGANACVALSGALLAQYNCFAEVRMGIGMVVIGLASLIIGELVVEGLLRRRTLAGSAVAAVLGSILYRFIIAAALELDFSASSMKLVTAVIVAAAMSWPALRQSMQLRRLRKGAK